MPKSCTIKDLLRPSRYPASNIPFGVYGVGHYCLCPPFTCNIVQRKFIQLFWCLSGSGVMVIRGVEHKLRAGDVSVYLPNMLHKWYTLHSTWEFRWIVLDGTLAESIVNSFGLQAAVYHVGPAPVNLFRRIENCLSRPSHFSETRACAAAFQILMQASFHQQSHDDSLMQDAIALIHRQWNASTFNINALAALLNINRSILSRRFHKFTGIPPIEYINKIRIQNVLTQLQSTDRTIQEIAFLCGYTDPAYVSRLVRQATGLSPNKFRANHQFAHRKTGALRRLCLDAGNKFRQSSGKSSLCQSPAQTSPQPRPSMCHDSEY